MKHLLSLFALRCLVLWTTVEYTINSGFAVGSPIDLRQYPELRAIGIPAITSGDLFIQGAMGTASGTPPLSGSFARLREVRAAGSGDLRFAVGPGSCWVAWPLGVTLPPFVRLETAVAQAAPSTWNVLTRRG